MRCPNCKSRETALCCKHCGESLEENDPVVFETYIKAPVDTRYRKRVAWVYGIFIFIMLLLLV